MGVYWSVHDCRWVPCEPAAAEVPSPRDAWADAALPAAEAEASTLSMAEPAPEIGGVPV